MSGIDSPWQRGGGDRLRFDLQSIDGSFAADVGEAFQSFCFELLREERPNLRRFPAAGRDGGIDLIDDGEAGREVFECKHVGSDGIDAARARWRSVEKNLQTHLPSRSQSQYAPWWDEERPIRRYVLCISSTLNQAGCDRLRQEIEAAFRKLADDSPHLRHLADLEVEVLHWPDLLSRLDDALALLFRWFPSSRPLGLVPVDLPVSQSVFSSFLHSSHLGYYSRDRHIAEHGRPDDVQIESEMEILARLDDTVGLIVTGSGGYGKTRLVHELGLLAQDEGWCVLRTAGPWRQESLARLATNAARPARILLLLDYVEMQDDFNDVVNDLIAINETFGHHIRYVANCRSSFYPRVAHLPQHEEVPLAPVHGVEWFREFRHHVVRHILDTGGVGVEARTLQVCRDVPVLAVFLVYLATTGRDDDLQELLGERDFGSWLRRRLEISFRGADGGQVPPVVAQFPVRGEEKAERLASREVLSTLEKDGWIEDQPVVGSDEDEREWSMVHDVLADRLLVSWLAERGSFARGEVEGLLDLAIENGTLASVISSLQRIRDHPEVEGIPFGGIVRHAFDQKPSTWLIQAPNVLNSSLLSAADAVSMLQSHKEIWRRNLSRWNIRQRIGWLAREVAAMPEPGEAIAIADWLQLALETEETDYLLRSGLLLSPAKTSGRAKKWINDRPTEFSTHFVISAWLAAGLPIEPIAQSTLAWLEVHAAHPRAWHVIARWLEGHASRERVDAYVLRWLEANRTLDQGPSYILGPWLKQGGRREDVDRYVLDWLAENAASSHGPYVLGHWIEAGGDLALAEPFLEPCLQWSDQPWGARALCIAWLNRGGPLERIRDNLEAWLETRPDGAVSWQVLDLFVRIVPKTPQLAEALTGRWGGSAQERGFGEVLYGWLASGGAPDVPQLPLREWLAEFGTEPEAGSVYSAWLTGGDAPDEIRAAAMDWFLTHPTDVQAGFLSKYFVLEEEMGIDAVRAILRWCAAFPWHEDALWRLTQLRGNLHRSEVWEEVLNAAEKISRTVLANPSLSILQATQMTSLFSFLITARGFSTGVAGDRCDALLLDYMRHPHSFRHGDHDLAHAERPAYVHRAFSLVLRGWMDVEADEPALERLHAWVGEWDFRYREPALRCVFRVADVLPA